MDSEIKMNAKKNQKSTTDLEELKLIKKELVIISKQVYRNLEFFYQSENIKQRRKILNNKIKVEENNYYGIVCKTLCEIVKERCEKKYNLNISTITCDKDEFGHVDLLLTTKNNNKYIINCLSDLERIQIGMRTKRFASEEYYKERYSLLIDNISFLTEEENKKIDEEIGYFNLMYMDDFFEELKMEFNELKKELVYDENFRKLLLGKDITKEKIEKISMEELTDIKIKFLLDFCNKRSGIIGHIELVRVYKIFSKQLFTKEEKSKINVFDCFFDKKKNDKLQEDIWKIKQERVRYLKIQIGEKIYLITTVDNKYVEMTLEEYKKFSEENKVYENRITSSMGLITEAIRNKGIGVNILKHIALKRKMQEIDEKASKLELEETKKIIEQIDKAPSNKILFSIGEDIYTIELKDSKIKIRENGIVTEYKYKNNNLVESTQGDKIKYKWKDEGKYKIIRKIKKGEGR